MNGKMQRYVAFMETARSGNMSKAAMEMGVSQPAVSKMISDLEDEWEIHLFNRERRGVRLTSDGERILPYVQEICRSDVSINHIVDEIKGIKGGTVRLGSFSSVATHIIPKILTDFQEKYPDLEFEILLGDYTEVEEWVRSGRLDLGFVKRSDDPNLEYRSVYMDEMRLVLPKGHPLSEKDVVSIDDLEGERFILLEKNLNTEVSELLGSHGVTPDIRYRLWDDYAIMSMIENGMGVGILHELVLRRIPYDLCIKPLDVEAHRDICIIRPRGGRMSLAASRMYTDIVEGSDGVANGNI